MGLRRSTPVISFLLIAILCGAMHADSLAPDYTLQEEEPDPSDFKAGAWTVVVIPDTQNYRKGSGKKKGHFDIMEKMFTWIAGQAEARNIETVVHVGDMTQRNTKQEWDAVREAYKALDGKTAYVPCEGNHDCGQGKPGEKVPTGMNDVFSIDQNPKNKESFGGSFEEGKLENAWYTFERGGQKFMILSLEYRTRRDVLQWASNTIRQHPQHRVLITVHSYMSEDSRLMSRDNVPRPYNGDVRRLVLGHPNVEFLVCGHVYAGVLRSKIPPAKLKASRKKGEKDLGTGAIVRDPDIATGHRTDIQKDGVAAHQILFNAQWFDNGGDGYVLLMEFQPGNKEVRVKTYSTLRNRWRIGEEYNYTLKRIGGRSRR